MKLTETRATRAKLPQSGQTILRCSELKGFAARLTPNGNRTWIVHVTYRGVESRLALGRVGVLPFEGPAHAPGARDLAVAAINAARSGRDPRLVVAGQGAPDGGGKTLDQVWEAYESAGHPKLKGVGRKRDSTIRADANRYGHWIAPGLGGLAVDTITPAVAQRWLDDIPTQGQRSHCLVLLKSLLSYAASRGLGDPPKIPISAGRSKELQNYYRPDELARLDQALTDLAAERPAQILPFTGLRVLLHTGARKSEILSLEWDMVDIAGRALHLTRHKGGENRRTILLTDAAAAALDALPRTSSRFVFPSDSATGHTVEIQKPWQAAIDRAQVPRLRLHDLRHSHASTLVGKGVGLFVVGKILGHRSPQTTQRYSHLEEGTARAALDLIATTIRGARNA